MQNHLINIPEEKIKLKLEIFGWKLLLEIDIVNLLKLS